MSAFISLMTIVQPYPPPERETPEQKKRREKREAYDEEFVGGIPRVNFWKGRE